MSFAGPPAARDSCTIRQPDVVGLFEGDLYVHADVDVIGRGVDQVGRQPDVVLLGDGHQPDHVVVGSGDPLLMVHGEGVHDAGAADGLGNEGAVQAVGAARHGGVHVVAARRAAQEAQAPVFTRGPEETVGVVEAGQDAHGRAAARFGRRSSGAVMGCTREGARLGRRVTGRDATPHRMNLTAPSESRRYARRADAGKFSSSWWRLRDDFLATRPASVTISTRVLTPQTRIDRRNPVTIPASLEGRRVLVVGASSGIGRALGLGAGAAGARVALGARRLDLVEEAAEEIRGAGGEARAWSCDVTSEADCARLVADAAAWMGGIDVVLYMSGSSPLVRMADAPPASLWHEMLATNLVGAALVVRSALEHLRAADDPVVVVTTHSMGAPWPWLGVYGTTKAALAELARAVAAEEPLSSGAVRGGGQHGVVVRRGWDPDVAGQAFEQWVADGLLRYEVLQCDEMADAIVAAVLDPSTPDELLIAGAEVEPGPRLRSPRARSVDLLHGGPGQLVHEEDRLGKLVGGQPSPGVVAQHLQRGDVTGDRATTTATPISPMTASRRGITATWATPGWSARTFSTSRG